MIVSLHLLEVVLVRNQNGKPHIAYHFSMQRSHFARDGPGPLQGTLLSQSSRCARPEAGLRLGETIGMKCECYSGLWQLDRYQRNLQQRTRTLKQKCCPSPFNHVRWLLLVVVPSFG